VGYRKGTLKIMFNVRYQKWERYDLASDPGELNSQVSIRDPDFIAQSDALEAWYQTWEDKTVVGEIGVMTEDDMRKFKDLGYIDTP